MKPWVVLVLLLVVGGLALWLRADRDADSGPPPAPPTPYDRPLLGGFRRGEALDPNELVGVRIDHLERSSWLAFERHEDGTFQLVDPLVWAAEAGAIGQLVDVLLRSRGPELVGAELADVGLDPPQAVVWATRRQAEGDDDDPRLRTWRVEVGAVDVDPRRIVVRSVPPPGLAGVEARVLRVPRSLETALARDVAGWRDRRLSHVDGRRAISVRRRGSARVQGGGAVPVDLTLDAVLESEGWRTAGRPRIGLDPRAVALVAIGATTLRASGFHDEAPTSLARYGLDRPQLTLEVEDEQGALARLSLTPHPDDGAAPVGRERWLAVSGDSDVVYVVDGHDVQLLVRPAEELYDHALVRTRREDVRGLELGEVVLELREDDWIVREPGPERPADVGAVEDALATLEHAFVVDWLPPDAGFVPSARIVVRGTQGLAFGGAVGEARFDPASGKTLHTFRRAGEDRVGLVPPEVARLVELGVESFVSRELVRLPELAVDALVLTQGERSRRFERRAAAWFDAAAPEVALAPGDPFFPVLEALLGVEVERWLAADGGGEPGDPLTVEFVGPGTRLELWSGPDGGVRARVAGPTGLVEAGLLALARSLLGP